MRSTTSALLALLGASLAIAAPSDNMLEKRALSYSGCYSSSSGLTSAPSYVYQSSSYCLGECGNNAAVIGLTAGSGCLCGNSLPDSSTKVSDSFCNTPCTGFGKDMCGGTDYYSVYTTGNGQLQSNPDSGSSSSAAASSSTQSSQPTSTTNSAPSSTSASATVVTSIAPGQTIVVTQSATPSSAPSSGGGSNTAGVAAGVVVGLVAVAAIIGGAFFYFRRRRQLAVEEEHRQRAQVSDFIQGGMERKPTVGSAPSFMSRGPDSRLDPEAGRRNSFGSVMDDSQDYSRKILRVANPDD